MIDEYILQNIKSHIYFFVQEYFKWFHSNVTVLEEIFK